MSSFRELAALIAATCVAASAQAQGYAQIGRAATADEVAAWDIDVRPDFKGLPKGAGSVAKGQDVWEGKCASCHGIFGESNEVFNPIVGGTTRRDIETGRVARLTDAGFPGRTTLMKLSTVSTLWDYINRAMPWTAPKSLSTEEVYAVTAYILNLGGIVGDDFVLSDRNIAEVQRRLPNRDGKTAEHGLWPGAGAARARPDTAAAACMNDCAGEARIASALPEHARNAHGNLAEQNRLVGAQRGADTSRPTAVARQSVVVPAAGTVQVVATPARAGSNAAAVVATMQKNACTACHGMDNNKIVGPGFADIARKYAGRANAAGYLAGKIKSGGSGVWGAVPMPPQALAEDQVRAIAQWLVEGAPKP